MRKNCIFMHKYAKWPFRRDVAGGRCIAGGQMPHQMAGIIRPYACPLDCMLQ